MANSPEQASNGSSQQPNVVDANLDLTVVGGRNYWNNEAFTWFVYIFAAITVGVLFWMSWIVFQQARPAIDEFGLGFLWGTDWNPYPADPETQKAVFGALPFIYGTVVSSTIAIIFAIPIGLSVALVTSEDFLPPSVRTATAFIVQLIAAIPSIIIGLWGTYVFVPLVLQPFEIWLSVHFGWIPLFKTQDPAGFNLMTAGIVLGIMILPTLAAISRDVLLVVPKELRSGSMALGSTRWEAIFRVILPTGLSGIVGAVMLALGRALGETIAVALLIGSSGKLPTLPGTENQFSASLLEAGDSIPAVLANNFGEAVNDPKYLAALMYLGLILFALTLAVNIAAVLLVQLLGAKQK
jgi:phosphate transport system permease protein